MNMSTRKTVIVDGEKITASVGLLNDLCGLAYEASERYLNLNCLALANSARRKADEIYDQLEKMGLYKK